MCVRVPRPVPVRQRHLGDTYRTGLNAIPGGGQDILLRDRKDCEAVLALGDGRRRNLGCDADPTNAFPPGGQTSAGAGADRCARSARASTAWSCM